MGGHCLVLSFSLKLNKNNQTVNFKVPSAFWHWFHSFQILMFWNLPCQSDSCLFVKLSNEQRGKVQERKPEGLSVPPDMAFVLVPAGRRQVLVEININKAAPDSPHRNTSHPGYKSKTYSLFWQNTMKGFLETSWKLTISFFLTRWVHPEEALSYQADTIEIIWSL